ncbi:hypothetical protein NQ318_012571 [Aromia moschata]|uniref:Uncharacterized protein n=1 Tax=Aromia moschata TaxID=1265417 RepID=A0AAV8YLV3_9CUCU|nr:hypothetical protein NQ318_012571 [Aromia moschata]
MANNNNSHSFPHRSLRGPKGLLFRVIIGTKDTASSELGAADFSKTGGQSYGDLERASHGEKGARGYSTIEEFEKALKGAKDNEQNKGFYKASGGKNGGGSFSDKNHSKKGSKTTGFHNVYLKDDYNKDHSFYDKADKRGYFRRYGDYRGNKHAQEGGFKNGRNHDSGFYGASTGAKGYTDKGKVFDEERGYKGAAGDEKYYQNGEEYAGNQGKNFGKEKGFAEGEKYTGR